jgi:hypothetical protein
MIALVVVSTFVVLLLGILVAGLLRSHADILRSLHEDGDARAVSLTNSGGRRTLLAFLSSGCATCAGFWHDLQFGGLDIGDVRVVIVTKGPDMEVPAEVRALSTGGVPVVMSTEAWTEYRVPASPFFVLVDGGTGRRIGHGVAAHTAQLTDLVRRAGQDVSLRDPHLDGPAREAANDALLVAAGITPGHRSLYPQSFRDVFPFASSDDRSRDRHDETIG